VTRDIITMQLDVVFTIKAHIGVPDDRQLSKLVGQALIIHGERLRDQVTGNNAEGCELTVINGTPIEISYVASSHILDKSVQVLA